MRFLMLSFVSALLLTGCASMAMEGYVGQSIADVALENGVPTGSFDLPDGRRVFQWNAQSISYHPGNTTTTSYAGMMHTNTYGGYMSEQECIYTLFAKLRADGKEGMLSDWIVTDFKKPDLDCE